MNNRGQVLALFALMLPIITIILILTIDVSNLVINKLEIDNINKILVDYAIDKKEEPNLEELVNNIAHLNDSKLEVNINITDEKINIILSKKIIGIITKTKIYDIKSNYECYYENNKKVIKRIKGDKNE